MNNGFLIPANTKKGSLILGLFRMFDICMFAGGILTTLVALAIIDTTNVGIVLICCLPAVITGFLVVPIPYYHNVLVAIQSIYSFYTERQKYEWRGWCIYDEFANETTKTKK